MNFKAKNRENNPGCQQSDFDRLLAAKIALYDDVSRLDAQLVQEFENSLGLSKLRQIEELAAMGIAASSRLHVSLSHEIRKGSVATESLRRTKERLAALEQSRAAILTEKQAEATALQEKLPPSLVRVTRTLSLAKQFRDAVKEYEANTPELKKKRTKLARLNRWKRFIIQAAQKFATAETALANERLGEIHSVCQDLFCNFVRGGPRRRGRPGLCGCGLRGPRSRPALGRGGERDQGPHFDVDRTGRSGRRTRGGDRQGA
jgi:hypothetical protein